MAAARIRTVRLKSGGAELRIMHNKRSDHGENWCGEVVRAARSVAEFSEPKAELCGFLVLGLYADGMHALSYRMDESRSLIPSTLMPSFVADLIRRDVITKAKFHAMFERT